MKIRVHGPEMKNLNKRQSITEPKRSWAELTGGSHG